ncbi:hypothetical protein BCD49_32785 [Pseudofrankia sp. EUN1h]|nr:hypothetical protein BCD49_32785 [Pseudofrankia sp. EUN1h]
MAALLVFVTTQIWGACELRLRWRHARLHEYLVRKAADNPADADLRTLLVDFAGTHPDGIGERLPLRPEFGRALSTRSRGR